MSSLQIERKIRQFQKAVFTLEDIALLAAQKKSSASVTAHRLVKKGILHHIERRRFCAAGEDSKAVASQIIRPSFISFRSALFLHGGTTQIPRGLQVACLRNRRALSYMGERISFHRLPAKAFGGFEPNRVGQKIYFLASKEKAIADCIAHPALCPLDEVKEAAGRFGAELDRKKCMEYASAYSSKSAKKRMKEVLSYGA